MASHTFEEVAGTSLSGFDPYHDTLTFATGSAVGLALSESDGDTFAVFGGQQVRLNGISLASLDGSQFLFADGSFLRLGSAGADTLQGGGSADKIEGGEGDDHLTGWAGGDFVSGGAGNDRLMTGGYWNMLSGIETLDGGSGNDTLFGGSNDRVVMTGGSGADVFAFYLDWYPDATILSSQASRVATPTRITDFSVEDGDLIGTGLSASMGASNMLVWRGQAADGFTGELGQSMTLAGDQPRHTNFRQVWTFVEDGNTVLFMDRGSDFVVDASDMKIVLDGIVLLTQASFTPASFLVQIGAAALTESADAAHGLSGNDSIDGLGGNDTIRGDHGDDALVGGIGADELHGNLGADALDGGADNDTLFGGVGSDTLSGGTGDDALRADGPFFSFGYAQEQDAAGTLNVLSGGDGNDQLVGGNGVDHLMGDAGTDNLSGGQADDTLEGGDGADTLAGGSGSDLLEGGAGADFLYFGAESYWDVGIDTVSGGDGDDIFWKSARGQAVLTGGAGADTFVLFDVWQYSYPAIGAPFSTVAAPDRISDFSMAEGDRIRAVGENAQYYHGTYLGLPLVWRGAADAAFTATSGESMDLAGSRDTRFYEFWTIADAGDTVLFMDSNRNFVVDAADFKVILGGAGALDSELFADDLIVYKVGTEGDDTGTSPGLSVLAEYAYGLEGNDTLDGLAGDDTLLGDDGDDHLMGGEGSDSLFGGNGDDLLDGGEGNDSLQGGVGVDTLRGGEGDDTLLGDGANDVLLGGAGADQLTTWAGSMALDGGGVVLLDGGDGDDELRALGTLPATLTGGAGADLFVFHDRRSWLDTIASSASSTVAAPRVITDFHPGEGDRIDGGAAWHALAWGGVAHEDFTATPGQVLASADGRPPDPRFAEFWLAREGGDTVLFMDSNRNGVVDSTDFKLLFEGTVALSWESFTPQTPWVGFGTSDDDSDTVVPLSALDDMAFGRAGNDTLSGLDGSDTISGDEGDDHLDGGAGVDFLTGGAGNDLVEGGDGSDVLAGSDGNDTLAGLAGRDWIDGDEGDDTLDGGDDDDHLFGGTGDDRIEGSQGDDWLLGAAGNDTLQGGEGNDQMAAGGYRSSGYLVYDFDEGTRNELHGGAGGDTLSGGAGSDLLRGGDGEDRIEGWAGDDTLDGGAGLDRMEGGSGNDTYHVDNHGDDIAGEWSTASGGIDTVITSIDWAATGKYVENLVAASGTTSIDLTGNTLANTLTGNDGRNILDGWKGADVMRGGKGNDTYHVDSTGDDVAGESSAASGGIDTVLTSIDWAATGRYVENLKASSGAAGIDLTGNTLANTLTGNDGKNILDGWKGADVMRGGKGNDTYRVDNAGDNIDDESSASSGGIDSVFSCISWSLTGDYVENLTLTGSSAINGTGNKLANVITGNGGKNGLKGEAGNDTLQGGAGADSLTGGSGSDRFVYAAASDSTSKALDRIADFTRGSDKIDLSHLDGNAGKSGHQDFSFIGSKAFGGNATGQLRFAVESGKVMLYGSTDADASAEFAVHITGTAALTGSDFLF